MKPNSDYRVVSLLGTAVAEILLPTLAGAWLGRELNFEPWGLLIGAFVGVGVCILHLTQSNRDTNNKEQP
jgi:F0F1-type ATP synthase assembly protein I